MKRLLLAGTAFLGLAASGSAVRATPIDFTYTGSLVTFTVSTTDTYQILAFGAQGGSLISGGLIGVGGLGAETGGDFSLTAGEILQIAVGGAGSSLGGGRGQFCRRPWERASADRRRRRWRWTGRGYWPTGRGRSHRPKRRGAKWWCQWQRW